MYKPLLHIPKVSESRIQSFLRIKLVFWKMPKTAQKKKVAKYGMKTFYYYETEWKFDEWNIRWLQLDVFSAGRPHFLQRNIPLVNFAFLQSAKKSSFHIWQSLNFFWFFIFHKFRYKFFNKFLEITLFRWNFDITWHCAIFLRFVFLLLRHTKL